MENEDDRGPETASDSFSLIEEKPLSQWRFEIRSIGKKHWSVFYRHFLRQGISNYPAFYRALKLYGDMTVFEAIIAASRQPLTGDPQAYVIKVAHSMWKEEQLAIEGQEDEDKEIQKAIEFNHLRNVELDKKLKKLHG